MTPIPMFQMRKLRQGGVHEFSQGLRSTMLAELGFESMHSSSRVCIITTTPRHFRTMNCFLLCPQESSYTLLDPVMLIVIILVITGKIQADNTVMLLEILRVPLTFQSWLFSLSLSPPPLYSPCYSLHLGHFSSLSDCKLCPLTRSFDVASPGTASQMMSPVTVGQRSLGQC